MNSEPHIVRSCECVGYTPFHHPLTSCHLPKASVFFFFLTIWWAIKTQLNPKDNLLLVKISTDTLQEEMPIMRYSKSY